MTRIRVTPEELQRAAQQLSNVSGEIGQVASELSSVLNELNPRAYDGQLYGKVAAQISCAHDATHSPVAKLSQHAVDLNRRAQAFNEVDQAAIQKMTILSQILLRGPGEVLGANVLRVAQRSSSYTPNTRNIALRVPSDGAWDEEDPGWYKNKFKDRGPGFYHRFSDNRVDKSDCTWFAAEAVRTASGGAIDLNNRQFARGHGIRDPQGWHGANEWASRATAYWDNYKDEPDNPENILARRPDNRPQAGDVIAMGNHVAFVEDAHYDDKSKKWTITIVEEDYYRGLWEREEDRVRIDSDPSVLRWRRILVYDSNPSDEKAIMGNATFIHFKYPPPLLPGLDLEPSPVSDPSASLRRPGN